MTGSTWRTRPGRGGADVALSSAAHQEIHAMGVRVGDAAETVLDPDAIAQYRREGYLVVRQVLTRDHVEQCLAALAAIAVDPSLEPGRRNGSGVFIALEPIVGEAAVDAGRRA